MHHEHLVTRWCEIYRDGTRRSRDRQPASQSVSHSGGSSPTGQYSHGSSTSTGTRDVNVQNCRKFMLILLPPAWASLFNTTEFFLLKRDRSTHCKPPLWNSGVLVDYPLYTIELFPRNVPIINHSINLRSTVLEKPPELGQFLLQGLRSHTPPPPSHSLAKLTVWRKEETGISGVPRPGIAVGEWGAMTLNNLQ